MKRISTKAMLPLAMAAGLLGTTWSTASHACSPDPYISNVCVMAAPNLTTGFNEYLPAAGQLLPISQNQALFALISNTYGGDGRVNFALPDMRGRVVVGAGQGPNLANYPAGQKGGAESFQITTGMLPQHSHTLSAAAKATVAGSFTAATTLSGLVTTTNLANVSFSASGSTLNLNGSTGGTLAASPTDASLGTTVGLRAPFAIYSDAAPTIAMKTGSITGTVSGTLSGTAPGTATGTATTTISGTPTVAMSGMTDAVGASAPPAVSIVQPYLAMNYFIAVTGTFPSRN